MWFQIFSLNLRQVLVINLNSINSINSIIQDNDIIFIIRKRILMEKYKEKFRSHKGIGKNNVYLGDKCRSKNLFHYILSISFKLIKFLKELFPFCCIFFLILYELALLQFWKDTLKMSGKQNIASSVSDSQILSKTRLYLK